jgi:hypothetical protein
MVRTPSNQQQPKKEKPNEMKATLTFDLREDQHAFSCAVNGVRYFDTLYEVQQHLRSLEKYQDLTQEQYDIVGKIREWLASELLDAGIADKF